MEINQKVKWTDPVSTRTRYGTLIEKEQVLGIIEADNDLLPVGEVKDINYWTWTIMEDKTNAMFCIKEEEIELILSN